MKIASLLVLLAAGLTLLPCSGMISLVGSPASDDSFSIDMLIVKQGAIIYASTYRTTSMFSSSDPRGATEWHGAVNLDAPRPTWKKIVPTIHHGAHIPSPGAAVSNVILSIPVWLAILPFLIWIYRLWMSRHTISRGFPVVEEARNGNSRDS